MALPLAGAKILAADLATIFPLGVGAWDPYTPTLTQSATISKTVTDASYTRIGRTITGTVLVFPTSSGTANNALAIGLPVAALTTGVIVGAGFIYDASAGQIYAGPVALTSATTMGIYISGGNGAAAGATGSGFTAAIANGDQVRVCYSYQAAS